MDSVSKYVFVRAGKHTSVHDMHPHSNVMLCSNVMFTSIANYYLKITTTKNNKTHIHTHPHRQTKSVLD